MSGKLIEEIDKSLAGEPSMVELSPIPEDELKDLQEIEDLKKELGFSMFYCCSIEETLRQLREMKKD